MSLNPTSNWPFDEEEDAGIIPDLPEDASEFCRKEGCPCQQQCIEHCYLAEEDDHD